MATLTDVPTENLRASFEAGLEANGGHRQAKRGVSVQHSDGWLSLAMLADVEAELVARARCD